MSQKSGISRSGADGKAVFARPQDKPRRGVAPEKPRSSMVRATKESEKLAPAHRRNPPAFCATTERKSLKGTACTNYAQLSRITSSSQFKPSGNLFSENNKISDSTQDFDISTHPTPDGYHRIGSLYVPKNEFYDFVCGRDSYNMLCKVRGITSARIYWQQNEPLLKSARARAAKIAGGTRTESGKFVKDSNRRRNRGRPSRQNHETIAATSPLSSNTSIRTLNRSLFLASSATKQSSGSSNNDYDSGMRTTSSVDAKTVAEPSDADADDEYEDDPNDHTASDVPYNPYTRADTKNFRRIAEELFDFTLVDCDLNVMLSTRKLLDNNWLHPDDEHNDKIIESVRRTLCKKLYYMTYFKGLNNLCGEWLPSTEVPQYCAIPSLTKLVEPWRKLILTELQQDTPHECVALSYNWEKREKDIRNTDYWRSDEDCIPKSNKEMKASVHPIWIREAELKRQIAVKAERSRKLLLARRNNSMNFKAPRRQSLKPAATAGRPKKSKAGASSKRKRSDSDNDEPNAEED